MNNDFNIRGKNYEKALQTFPKARRPEENFLLRSIKPKNGQTILDLACGSGHFTKIVYNHTNGSTKLIGSDISNYFIKKLRKEKLKNTNFILNSETHIPLANKSVDTIFSYTGFHHFSNQSAMTKECERILKRDGKLFVFDIFDCSPNSKYMDDLLGKYSSTGHEGKYLTKEYTETLAFIAKFSKISFLKEKITRKFKTINDLTTFFKELHALSCSKKVVLKGLKKHLKIKKIKNEWHVSWPIGCVIFQR
ncbi:MAG: class I SAM-dependent methyltransferase [Candidatus Magasanikbacteria bacterium]|nr:class I SAM-dependent methyltransferase [Candidatus Magasanikbacteria bacterium]